MKVSILCTTYNHEKYIEEAINGIMSQRFSFDFEIVIGDDASEDQTFLICRKYKKKFPEKIKLLDANKNHGIVGNFVRTLKVCSGEYVAICEGDDYWIDEEKLEKQVSFLDSHTDFAICYHRVYEKYGRNKLQLEKLNTSTKDCEYSVEDLAKGNFIYTPSVVFKNKLFKDFPPGINAMPICDYILHMINASHGRIKYLATPMAVYRRHSNGAWSLRAHEFQALNFICLIDYLVGNFEGNVRNSLIVQKAEQYSGLARLEFGRNDIEKAKEYIEMAIKTDCSFREKWLYEFYPALLRNVYNSRKYKLGDKIATYLRKLNPKKY